MPLEAPAVESDEMEPGFRLVRRAHLVASGLVALFALIHSILTFVMLEWGPYAVWFLGTGLGLLLLSVLNLTHIGIEPCRRSTARLIRWCNWGFALFGGAAVFAVPEPQAYAVLAGLAGQAVAGQWTLPGPHRAPRE